MLVELGRKKAVPSGHAPEPDHNLSHSAARRVGRQTGWGKVDRSRYEAEIPNDIWQSDVMHGPSLVVDGGRRKTYLIAFLDDHLRLLPHAEFFLSENLQSLLAAFRRALLTRRQPRKLYADNGAPFRSRHLERICDSLGIALTHTPLCAPGQGRDRAILPDGAHRVPAWQGVSSGWRSLAANHT